MLRFLVQDFIITIIIYRARFQALVEDMNQFTDAYIASADLKSRMNAYLYTQWQYNKAYELLWNDHIFWDATIDIKNGLRKQIICPVLVKCPLFQVRV